MFLRLPTARTRYSPASVGRRNISTQEWAKAPQVQMALERPKVGRSGCRCLSGLRITGTNASSCATGKSMPWWTPSSTLYHPPRVPWISYLAFWVSGNVPPPKSAEGTLWGCEGEGTGCRMTKAVSSGIRAVGPRGSDLMREGGRQDTDLVRINHSLACNRWFSH